MISKDEVTQAGRCLSTLGEISADYQRPSTKLLEAYVV